MATSTTRPSVSTRSAPYRWSRCLRTASAYQAPVPSSGRLAVTMGRADSTSAARGVMKPSSAMRRST